MHYVFSLRDSVIDVNQTDKIIWFPWWNTIYWVCFQIAKIMQGCVNNLLLKWQNVRHYFNILCLFRVYMYHTQPPPPPKKKKKNGDM